MPVAHSSVAALAAFAFFATASLSFAYHRTTSWSSTKKRAADHAFRHDVFAVLLIVAACGGSTTRTTDGGLADAADASPPDAGLSPTGTPGCTLDMECAQGVCWDIEDYDTECWGTICSLTCTTDADCQAAAEAAGASLPDLARCDTDNRCNLVGAGLGLFTCA